MLRISRPHVIDGPEMNPESKDQVRARYDRFSRWYDLVEGIPERLFGARVRRRLVPRARGDVLEVGIGTGFNLPYYPPDCRITGIDLSVEMRRRAAARAESLGREIRLLEMDVEDLRFPDASFDTVVVSMMLCTFPRPERALAEMKRVCRPDGRILMIEHGRSCHPLVARLQDAQAERHARRFGCRWDRDLCAIVRACGLEVEAEHRAYFGILHGIAAHPAPRPT